jgi:hypothetical protein
LIDLPDEWAGDLAGLDELAAFDVMRRFLHNWWERSGRPDHGVFEEGDVRWLLSACDRDLGRGPADPAMWSDWKNAVAEVRRDRESGIH